jgi:hypothetical protein
MRLPYRFLSDAMDGPLSPFGFARVDRRQVWMRSVGDLAHAVSLEWSRGSWGVRWDVVHPSVGELLHGKHIEPHDVAYSGFITGWAQPSLGPDVIAHFKPADVQDNNASLMDGVGRGAAQVAGWTNDFATARSIIEYLIQDPGQKLVDPRVVIPVNWPLRLYTAAALAVVEGESDGTDLADRAAETLAATDPRIDRLRRAQK